MQQSDSLDRTRPLVWEPPLINELADTGLRPGQVQELILKTLYVQGQLSAYTLADLLHLPFQTAVREEMEFLKRQQLVEVVGSDSVVAGQFVYEITGKGAERAREYMARTTYIGPAPVTWQAYVTAVQAQGSKQFTVHPDDMRSALEHLVLPEVVLDRIGPAVNSGRSLFLYGPSGNGKTSIAESIGRLFLTDDLYIPYAVVVEGQIIKLFDESSHARLPEPAVDEYGQPISRRRDQRWVRIRRPAIIVGGELTLDSLELRFDPINKFYEAPLQMKANGGMFLIDDFGRQAVRPDDLLNRWIVPMERRVDFLSLRTGGQVAMPFELLIVFATNLPPGDLVDEAFLRRIRHKVAIESPDYDTYRQIFERACKRYGIEYSQDAVVYLLKQHYVQTNRPLRASHPRDLLEQIRDFATYLDIEPQLTRDMIDRAVASYFVDL